LKITNTEKGWWREAQVVECLPSKPEALSSNLSIAKKKHSSTIYYTTTTKILKQANIEETFFRPFQIIIPTCS
jgi:hypothetical protein